MIWEVPTVTNADIRDYRQDEKLYRRGYHDARWDIHHHITREPTGVTPYDDGYFDGAYSYLRSKLKQSGGENA